MSNGTTGRSDFIYGTLNSNPYGGTSRGTARTTTTAGTRPFLKVSALKDITCVLDPALAPRMNAWVATQKKKGAAIQRINPGLVAWMLKGETRVLRIAAELQIVKHVEMPTGVPVLPIEEPGPLESKNGDGALDSHDHGGDHEGGRCDSWRIPALPQQQFFYDVLVGDDQFKVALMHHVYNLLANYAPGDVFKRENFWGDHCLPTSLRIQDERTREEFAHYVMGYGFLRKTARARAYKGGRTEAHWSEFEIVPEFFIEFAPLPCGNDGLLGGHHNVDGGNINF